MTPRSIITIGNFDGVHCGHRQILSRASHWAKNNDAQIIVITFDPHPMSVLKPELAPQRLCNANRREAILKDLGADEVHFYKPEKQLLQLEPEDFVVQMVERYNPAVWIEGDDFHFGKNRRGNIQLLQELGQQHQFEVDIVPTCDVTLTNCHIVRASSSIIRWLIEQGRVADARIVMQRPFTFESVVVQGEKVGRTIGFPTINLDLELLKDHQIPKLGVYSGRATFQNSGSYAAAISIGIKPTFGIKQLCIEAHLLDCNKDLYSQQVQLEFHQWIRDQYPFPSIQHLKAQLKRDVQQIRNLSKAQHDQPMIAEILKQPSGMNA
ncbi:Riboflavin kinase [Poriferisphaera corsica]|uniref:Riboflavin biosynthesis protein n=1 Tax=Poriferisphaera corsica TaxID=2528020 RepID=A0A517YUH0_9BACT|nr:bifunctional riboflavin kinase/FAD synthetase [Poriferisphaera corsica]QDU33871.1 Riboflavin kinase [Poriferisphaera corsica]